MKCENNQEAKIRWILLLSLKAKFSRLAHFKVKNRINLNISISVYELHVQDK